MPDDTVTVPGARPDTNQTEADELKRRIRAYNTARSYDENARKQYAIDRSYAAGTFDPRWAVDANLIGSYVDILVAYIYARDPAVRIRPTEAAVKAQPRDRQDFAKTLQIVVTRLWHKARLKRCMKKAVRSGYSIGIGWFKGDVYIDTQEDPVIVQKLNDVKDNLERIRVLREELETGSNEDKEQDQIETELRDTMAGLEANVEILMRKAFVIDFVRAENMTVALNVGDIDDYLDADWIAIDIFIQKDELKERFKRLTDEDVRNAKTYYQTTPTDYSKLHGKQELKAADASQFTAGDQPSGGVMTDGDGKNIEFAKVVEIHSRRDNMIRTAIDGLDKWAKEPYAPRYGTSRFYPFFKVDMFQVDGERHPQSLCWRLSKLQDEYASARSNFRATRERMIPGVIVNGTKIDKTAMKLVRDGVGGEYIVIEPTDPEADLNKCFAAKPLPNIDWRIFQTDPIIGDMEKISGVQEAQQTSQTIKKTATQAEIEQSGFTTRTTAQRDGVEDTLKDFAEYTAELALQCLTYEEVQKMAGALAFWPEELPLEDVTALMDIEIEAGSTGRPNTAVEREAWARVLPLLMELMGTITEARRMGDESTAEALTELIRETLTREGDRIDVERFIPDLNLPTGDPTLAGPGAPAPGPAAPAPGGGGGRGVPAPGPGQTPAPGAQADPLAARPGRRAA